MAAIVINGMATSFDLPNYYGSLFRKRQQENAFLRIIGGLNGAIKIVNSIVFPMGTDYEVPDGSQRGATEGAAPPKTHIGIAQSTNLLQIFQEGVDLTYTRQSTTGQIAGLAVVPGAVGGVPLQHPGSLQFQLDRRLDQIQNDLNFSMLRGTYQMPADNTTPRKMRGLRSAITSNLFGNAGVLRPLTKALVDNAIMNMIERKMFSMGGEIFVMGTATMLAKLIEVYLAANTQNFATPPSRSVVGVAIRQIVTTFGILNLVWEPAMANGELLFVQPQYITPVALNVVVNGQVKGLLFAEPLAKVGSSDQYQVYGEWGIDYTDEDLHALITDIDPSA
jgi:hypothetical protein